MKPYYDHAGIAIYHGDLRDVLPSIPDESVDMIWTDPPYGHSNLDGDLASARVGVKGGRQARAVAIQNDDAAGTEAVLETMFTHAVRVMKRECCCCCCCCGGGGPDPAFAKVAQRMDRDGLKFFHAVVWDKSARGNGLGWRYRRNYEFVMVGHRTGGKLAWQYDDVAVPNIIRTAPVANDEHPTTKPEGLVGFFLKNHTKPNDLVLDPFMGSGTTLVEAKNLGRRAIGIELEERYCEVAARRLRQEILL